MWGHFSEEYFLENLDDLTARANDGYAPNSPGYIINPFVTLFPEDEYCGPCYVMLYLNTSYDLDEAEKCVKAGEIDSWEYWHHTKRVRLLEIIKASVPHGLERVLVHIEV